MTTAEAAIEAIKLVLEGMPREPQIAIESRSLGDLVEWLRNQELSYRWPYKIRSMFLSSARDIEDLLAENAELREKLEGPAQEELERMP